MVSAINSEFLHIRIVAVPIAPEDVRRELEFRKLSRTCWSFPTHSSKHGVAWTLDVFDN
jgi:hypothetical protein